MPATLIKTKAHLMELLALYVQVDGIATDAFKVEYQVFNASASFPGTAVIPATGKTNVTTGSGHFATGAYGVWNAAAVPAAAWTPADTMVRGYVLWTYTVVSGEAERTARVDFEVVDSATATQETSGLALIQDVRDAGAATTLSNLKIHLELMRWRDLVERYCRQHFRPIREKRRFLGLGAPVLFLPEPLFSLETFLNDTLAYDVDVELRVWGATGDDRKNPKVETVRTSTDIFSEVDPSHFSADLPQYITGVWGFIETTTMGPPELIRDAVARGVVATLTSGSSYRIGPIVSEKTDIHSISYGASVSSTRPDFLAVLKDAGIRDVLDLYRGPIGIASSSNATF